MFAFIRFSTFVLCLLCVSKLPASNAFDISIPGIGTVEVPTFQDVIDAFENFLEDISPAFDDNPFLKDVITNIQEALDKIDNVTDAVTTIKKVLSTFVVLSPNGLLDIDKTCLAGLSKVPELGQNALVLLHKIDGLEEIWDNFTSNGIKIALNALPGDGIQSITRIVNGIVDVFEDELPFPLDIIDDDASEVIAGFDCLQTELIESLVGWLHEVGTGLVELGKNSYDTHIIFQIDDELREGLYDSSVCIKNHITALRSNSENFNNFTLEIGKNIRVPINYFDYDDNWSIGLGVELQGCIEYVCGNFGIEFRVTVDDLNHDYNEWAIIFSLGPTVSTDSDLFGASLQFYSNFATGFEPKGSTIDLQLDEIGLNIGNFFNFSSFPGVAAMVNPLNGDFEGFKFSYNIKKVTDKVQKINTALSNFFDKTINTVQNILPDQSFGVSLGYRKQLRITGGVFGNSSSTGSSSSSSSSNGLNLGQFINYGSLFNESGVDISDVLTVTCPEYTDSDGMYVMSYISIEGAVVVNVSNPNATGNAICDFTAATQRDCPAGSRFQCSFPQLNRVCGYGVDLEIDINKVLILYNCPVIRSWSVGCFDMSNSTGDSDVLDLALRNDDGTLFEPLNALECASKAYEEDYDAFAIWVDAPVDGKLVNLCLSGDKLVDSALMLHHYAFHSASKGNINGQGLHIDDIVTNLNDIDRKSIEHCELSVYYFAPSLIYKNLACLSSQLFGDSLTPGNVANQSQTINQLQSMENFINGGDGHVLLLDNWTSRSNPVGKCNQVAFESNYKYFALYGNACFMSNYWSEQRLLNLVGSQNLTKCNTNTISGNSDTIAFYQVQATQASSSKSKKEKTNTALVVTIIVVSIIVIAVAVVLGLYFAKKLPCCTDSKKTPSHYNAF